MGKSAQLQESERFPFNYQMVIRSSCTKYNMYPRWRSLVTIDMLAKDGYITTLNEYGRRLEQNTRRSDSNRSPKGDQINVPNCRLGEILSLEDFMIREVHYNAQDSQEWLLDFGATFHFDPKHQMVFKCFGWNEWHNPTQQQVGVCNCRNQRGSHSITK